MKLNLACGPHHLDGFENLDKETGWTFEQGLPYPPESIEAITESHGLMYVALADWPFVFNEFVRVLEPGGVLRITEDATDDPRSPRYGGFEGAVTLTTRGMVRIHLLLADLQPIDVSENTSNFHDNSLIQSWHNGSPKCFFIEGVKP